MPVTIQSSGFAAEHRQVDQSRWVREIYVLSNGRLIELYYLASTSMTDDDINALVSTRSSGLLAQLAQDEITANVAQVIALGSGATPLSLIYSSVSQNADAIRQAWANATKLDAIMIGDYLNSLSNAVLMVAFGWSLLQVTTLRANALVGLASVATTIRNAAGQ